MPKRSRDEMQPTGTNVQDKAGKVKSPAKNPLSKPMKLKLPCTLSVLHGKVSGTEIAVEALVSKRGKRALALFVKDAIPAASVASLLATKGNLELCAEVLSQYVGMRCVVCKFSTAKETQSITDQVIADEISSQLPNVVSKGSLKPIDTAAGAVGAWISQRDFRTDEAGLQLEADEIVADYEAREKEVEAALDSIGEAADDRGFRTVTRADEGRLVESDRARKKRRKTGSAGIGGVDDAMLYRFARREKQLAQLQDVRSRFKADRAKVQRVRDSRQFKPF